MIFILKGYEKAAIVLNQVSFDSAARGAVQSRKKDQKLIKTKE